MSDKDLPKFFKDGAGFCYVATPALAEVGHLSPWDGAIDARGFAVPEVAPSENPPSEPTGAEEQLPEILAEHPPEVPVEAVAKSSRKAKRAKA